MKPLSARTVRIIESISHRTKDELICKICEHLLNSKNDMENAMNLLIEDAALYNPFNSPDLGELLVAVATDVRNKIMYKRPRR